MANSFKRFVCSLLIYSQLIYTNNFSLADDISKNTETVTLIGEADKKICTIELDTDAEPKGGMRETGGIAKQVRRINLSDGSQLIAAISADGSDEVYLSRFSKDGHPIEGFTKADKGPAVYITFGTTASGNPMLFAIGKTDLRAHYMKLDASGHPTTKWIPLGSFYDTDGRGTSDRIAVTNLADGTPILFSISGWDKHVYAQHFDSEGNPKGNWWLMARGKVSEIAAAQDERGNPILFAVGSENKLAHYLPLTKDGKGKGPYIQVQNNAEVEFIKLWGQKGSSPLLVATGAANKIPHSIPLTSGGKPQGRFKQITGMGAVDSVSIGTFNNQPILLAIDGQSKRPCVARVDEKGQIKGGVSYLGEGKAVGIEDNIHPAIPIAIAAAGLALHAYNTYLAREAAKREEERHKMDKEKHKWAKEDREQERASQEKQTREPPSPPDRRGYENRRI